MNLITAQENFFQEINQLDKQINLAKACLYIAQIEQSKLDTYKYLNILEQMADEIRPQLPENLYPLKVIQTINQYLFQKLGFTGNVNNYYDPRNSYLNSVIDRRLGIPITLSVIYLEIAKKLDFPMIGIGMPGHFLIRPNFEDVEIFVDTFHQGEILFIQDCQQRIKDIYQDSIEFNPSFLRPVSNKQILARILTNLKLIYVGNEEFTLTKNVIDFLLLLFPNNPRELKDRGIINYRLGDWEKAALDLENYLVIMPDAEDALMIRELLAKIKSQN